MRQVITLDHFWKYHQQAKQILKEQNISNLLQTRSQSPTETLKWYIKKRTQTNPFLQYKNWHSISKPAVLCLVVFRKPVDSSTYEQKTLKRKKVRRTDRQAGRQTDRQKEQQGHGNRDVTVITHPASRGFDGRMWNSSDNPHRNHSLWCILLVVNEP